MAFDDDIVEESKTTSLSQCTGPNQRLIDMVLSNPDKLLLQALNIRNKKSASGQAVLDYCKALFSILGPPARRNSSSRPATVLLHLVVRLLTIVQGNRIAVDRTFAQCLELIIQELDAVPSKSIPHIVEPIVNQMQNSGFAYGSDADDVKILRIIPRSLSIICNSSQLVEVPESDGNANFCIGGSEYVESVFKRMLSSPIWTKTVLLEIATLLPEMPLDEAYVAEFVHTILSHLRNVDPIEYPAIMYQLLLLASKKFKRHILVGILAFCSSTFSVLQEATSDKDIAKKSSVESCRQVEGTILLHINFAVKQNPALGQEVVNLVKSGCLPFTSFIFSVLLSLARIRRFEESSMNLLKVFASKAYQDWRMSRSSSCITPGLKKQCLEGVASLERAIMRTVQNTAFGWDHVIPTLVSFGFMMVEASQSGDPVHADTTVKPIQSSGCKDLGAMVLQTTFEVHELARHEIVEQSKSRILQLKHEQSTTIVRMIGQLVQANPHIMLDHICHLKECLDYYAFLHPSLAASLFQSIRPLFQLSSDLQGYAILVLRKAMFGRETTARINALQGLINLLIAERDLKARNDIDSLLNSSNEASCSQQGHIYPNRMPSLLNELKGLLRRCLSQQAKIRELLYQGLVKLVMIDPSAADIAFNLLWSHFCRYYKTAEDSNLPLDIGSCVKIQSNSAFVEEPLDHLIFSIYNLITLQPQEEEQNILSNPSDDFSLSQEFEDGRLSAISSLRDAFQNMRKSLIQGSLAALNMDKSQDFSVDTVEGRKNLEKAHICLGICEILIDSAVSQVVKYPTGPRKDEAEKDLLCCIATYHAIEEILQKHANGSGCRSRPLEPSLSVKPVGKMQSGSIQSMETSKPFLSAVNSLHLLRIAQKSDGLQMPQSAISVPSSQRNDQEQLPDIMSYRYRLAHLAIKSCLRHVKAAGTVFVHSENRYDVKELGGDWKILGRPILDAVDDAVIESSGVFSWSVQKKEREKQGRGKRSAEESREGLVLILVKCLDEIWRLAEKKNCISEVFSQPMGKSCDTVSIESSELRAKISSDSVSEQAFLGELMSASIQPLLEQLLHRSQFREFEVLSGMVLGLGSRLQSQHMKSFGSWAEEVCKVLKLTFNGAAKALIKMALCLLPPPNDLHLAQSFSQELLKVMGTDEQEPIEISGVYHVINTSTKNCIAGTVLQHAENVLFDADWFISKLKLSPISKADILSESFSQSQNESSRIEAETTLHKRLENLVLCLANFVQMNLTGAIAEQFLKITVKLYKCLAATTRLCIAPKGYKQTAPSVRFQSLAEVTCKKLTAPLYTFMAIMQRDQQENCAIKGTVNKIKREVRIIPNLVFHVEDYERYLIQLSRLTKVNLLRHAKRSTARDFKILEDGKKFKCAFPVTNNEEELAREESGNAHSPEDLERETGSQEEMDSEEDKMSEDDEDQGEEAPSIRFRRPMEKRRRKTIVQDSDDEDEDVKT